MVAPPLLSSLLLAAAGLHLVAADAAPRAAAHEGPAVSPLRVDGNVAAVFTPYDAEGGLALGAVKAQAAYLRETGATGVFVGGTTGDSLALTLSERKRLLEAWVHHGNAHQLVVIAHVGAEALGDAEELAAHAQQAGAQAIGCMPSVFFKPATPRALALWMQRVAQAAPRMPAYYYHIPSMTGVKFKMLDFAKAMEEIGPVPNFVGIKYTGLYEAGGWMDFEQTAAYKNRRYEVLSGREEMTLQALSIGTRGFIGSQMNFAADVYGAITCAWPNVTRGEQIQRLAIDLMTTLQDMPAGVSGFRLAMSYAGIDIGPARLPHLQASAGDVTSLHRRLDAWCEEAHRLLGWQPRLCVGTHKQQLVIQV